MANLGRHEFVSQQSTVNTFPAHQTARVISNVFADMPVTVVGQFQRRPQRMRLQCFPIGIIAWLAARDDLKAMDDGRRDPSGRSLVVAGQVCGGISVALGALWLFVGLLAVLG